MLSKDKYKIHSEVLMGRRVSVPVTNLLTYFVGKISAKKPDELK